MSIFSQQITKTFVQILSLGLSAPSFRKMLVTRLVGRVYFECARLHAIEQLKFFNPLFHLSVYL